MVFVSQRHLISLPNGGDPVPAHSGCYDSKPAVLEIGKYPETEHQPEDGDAERYHERKDTALLARCTGGATVSLAGASHLHGNL